MLSHQLQHTATIGSTVTIVAYRNLNLSNTFAATTSTSRAYSTTSTRSSSYRCPIHVRTTTQISSATAPTSLHSTPHHLLHTSSLLSSITGISFQPKPPAELKVTQWLKSQEIAARRKFAHKEYEKIWEKYPEEDWSKLTPERSRQLLMEKENESVASNSSSSSSSSSVTEPSEWDKQEFYLYTLSTHVPWRYLEVQHERKEFFESCLSRLFKDLRAESDAYRYGTMQMTKNELTRRLTLIMDKLPSANEVEDAWSDRHSIPAIEWLEDYV